MIIISDVAKMHFIKLLKNQKKGTQIRIFVTNPGMPNAKCEVSYCSIDNVTENDIKLKFEKLIIYIDEFSAPYLKDAEIDLVTNQLGSQLIVNAPNIKIAEIYRNSSLMKRVEYFLQSKINPQLSDHNGYVSLMLITDDNYVILKFGGNCNGCSMVKATLKEGIEKQLMNEFPELKGVRDITKHQFRKHSYY